MIGDFWGLFSLKLNNTGHPDPSCSKCNYKLRNNIKVAMCKNGQVV